ncbi:hypothetical protein HanXRQr2_Chr10g0431221 [Helianthus annuus]|uniref:Uncharacterized protein n=1 Tax=Helianthus annuus TaxID=4232 RepID=A0A9K3HW50_HELAN|nr:hypothetical protein HanXRQr2_Chr10g0431221 [Helianthus annuus]
MTRIIVMVGSLVIKSTHFLEISFLSSYIHGFHCDHAESFLVDTLFHLFQVEVNLLGIRLH